jgi:hypothetical protein
VAENKSEGGRTAVKVHRESEPYLRERAVYERRYHLQSYSAGGKESPKDQLPAADGE